MGRFHARWKFAAQRNPSIRTNESKGSPNIKTNESKGSTNDEPDCEPNAIGVVTPDEVTPSRKEKQVWLLCINSCPFVVW